MRTCDLDHLRHGLVEELTIMRHDHIASLPGLFEIVLEPLDTREVYEVRRLIEEEKCWLREECLRKCDLRTLTSGYLCETPIE